MTENEIKEATFEDALYCAKALVGFEACEECRFYKLCHVWCDDVYGIMYKALEEIKQYRAIGTIEEIRALKEKMQVIQIIFEDMKCQIGASGEHMDKKLSEWIDKLKG